MPALVTIGYAALQVAVERRNYLLRGGEYGLGPQLVSNPLRSLALIVAPLPGTEQADAPWLVPLGAVVALGLLALFVWGSGRARRLVLALLLTLLPTAPFASPPDSRYLYLPVLAAALLLAVPNGDRRTTTDERRTTNDERRTTNDERRTTNDERRTWFKRSASFSGNKTSVFTIKAQRTQSLGALCAFVVKLSGYVGRVVLVILLVWGAVGEVAAREGRFATASGPGGSLWRTATAACREDKPKQVIVIEPPLAPLHVEAIIYLSCGHDVRPVIVGRDQLSNALKRRSVVIGFNEGTASVEQRT